MREKRRDSPSPKPWRSRQAMSAPNMEAMYMRALKGYEKALCAEHTSTLDTSNNPGLFYSNQGKIAKAEEIYIRALEGKEKA